MQGDVEFGGAQAPDEETLRFVETARERSPRLVAVLAGHIHSAQVQVLSGGGTAVQYVTEAGCNDGYRIVDFLEGAAAPKL